MKFYLASRKILGERIRRQRVKLGISQEQLAFTVEIDTSYMGAVERGNRNPSFRILCSIADALKVGLSPLVKDLPLDDREK